MHNNVIGFSLTAAWYFCGKRFLLTRFQCRSVLLQCLNCAIRVNVLLKKLFCSDSIAAFRMSTVSWSSYDRKTEFTDGGQEATGWTYTWNCCTTGVWSMYEDLDLHLRVESRCFLHVSWSLICSIVRHYKSPRTIFCIHLFSCHHMF